MKNRKTRFIAVLLFLSISVKAQDKQASFVSHLLASDTSLTEAPAFVSVGDIDSDGDPDFVGSSNTSNAILWFDNQGNDQYLEKVVSTDTTFTTGARHLVLVDLDGDNAMDIVSSNDNESFYGFKNNGEESFEGSLIFKDITLIDDVNSVGVGDMDNDGDPDIVGVGSSLVLLENEGLNFTPSVLDTPAKCCYSAVDLVDIDDNGFLDVIASLGTTLLSSEDSDVFLFKNDGNQFERVLVADSTRSNSGGWRRVGHSDLNNDGRMDIVANERFRYATWFSQNADGTFTQRPINPQANFGQVGNAFEIHINNDQVPGIGLTLLNDDKVILFENDGLGNFSEFKTIDGFDQPIFAAPIMNSGGNTDLIIVNRLNNSFDVASNPGDFDYTVSQSFQRVSRYNGVIDLELVDIDGDDDLDVLSTTLNRVFYHINDGEGGFDDTIEIPQDSLSRIEAIELGDTDNNGTQEVFLVGNDLDGAEAILWIKEDLSQEILAFNDLPSKLGGCGLILCKADIEITDVNDDGFVDILYATPDLDLLAYLENNQNGSFERIIIDENAADAVKIIAYDFDGDGDKDIIGSFDDGSGDNFLGIYLNDGQGSFEKRTQPVTVNPVFDIAVADLDGDAGNEIILIDYGRGIKYWQGIFGEENISIVPEDPGGTSRETYRFQLEDLDLDGDLDIIGAVPNQDEYGWFENREEGFYYHPIKADLFKTDYPISIKVGDISGNDTLDIVGANFFSDNIVWFETKIEEIPVLSTSELVERSLHVYPNPVAGILRVFNPVAPGKTSYTLTNLSGRLMKKEEDIKDLKAIDMSSLAPGLYILNFDLGDRVESFKLIKR